MSDAMDDLLSRLRPRLLEAVEEISREGEVMEVFDVPWPRASWPPADASPPKSASPLVRHEDSERVEQELMSLRDALEASRSKEASLTSEIATVLDMAQKIEERANELSKDLSEARLELDITRKDAERFLAEGVERQAAVDDLSRQVAALKEGESAAREAHAQGEQRLAEAAQSREKLESALAGKERECRLLRDDLALAARRHKELIAQRGAAKEVPGGEDASSAASPAPAVPAPSVDLALSEKAASLETAVAERDRLLSDRQQELDQARERLENLQQRLEKLDGQNKLLEEAVAGRGQPLEELRLRDKWAAQMEQLKKAFQLRLRLRNRKIEHLSQELEEHRRSGAQREEKEKALAQALEDRSVLQGELQQLTEQRRDLTQRNEELEAQTRLLVMNSEIIDQIEKKLRESFRLMAPVGTKVVPVAAAGSAPSVSGENRPLLGEAPESPAAPTLKERFNALFRR